MTHGTFQMQKQKNTRKSREWDDFVKFDEKRSKHNKQDRKSKREQKRNWE